MNAAHTIQCRRHRISTGFSLIELMITVAIVAIIATIAIPNYTSYVRRSHRTDVKNALLNMASLEERYFSSNNSYTADPTMLGYPATIPIAIGTTYSVAAPGIVAATSGTAITAPTVATYSITGTPVGTQAQDTACASFTITSLGAQTALNSGGADNSQTCWH